MIFANNGKLIRVFDGETMQVEAYGVNSLRVRVTRLPSFSADDWALLPCPDTPVPAIMIRSCREAGGELRANAVETVTGDSATITNGILSAEITEAGKLVFRRGGKVILREFESDRKSMLGIPSRELKSLAGGNFRASMKFASDPKEKLFGMGQYQNGIFNLKGCFLELAQRNSQASVPFLLSDGGYGFLWNNPAIGRASFGTNLTEWEAFSTRQIEFWITAEDTPDKIMRNYACVTGRPPMMPEYGLGFWQSKLRYTTQDELLSVAREYRRRGIPLDVIVADFFHWTLEGTWAFDPQYWPDPESMVKELDEMGVRLMVSVWPTVAMSAPDYEEMRDRGLLVQSESGVKANMLMLDPTRFIDVSNPRAREYLWEKIRKNYVSKGIKSFWLDVAEPEYSCYDFENYRYYKGSDLEAGNEYPALYAKTFYDGLISEGETEIVSLVRCAWAGSQRYGALVWSGDIPSTFEALRIQIVCGLQMAVAGIPWWTTDIGGFFGGDINDPQFRELAIRWFQYGAFCPVMRLHGNRKPEKPPVSNEGGGRCGSGADNEIWSFGDEAYRIMKKYIDIRERLRPYIRRLMREASDTGAPVMRPLFYHFPADKKAWETDDQFMFGPDILVAPVTEYGARQRDVYLPAGADWTDAANGRTVAGGQRIRADAPLDAMPLFVRAGAPDPFGG